MSDNLNEKNKINEMTEEDSDIVAPETEKEPEQEGGSLFSDAVSELKPKKKKSLLKTQKRFIALLLVFTILLSASAAVVAYIVSRDLWVDTKGDGAKYYVMEKGGVYVITDKDGYTLDKTDDGKHYVTLAGNVVDVDEKTGEVSYYAYVDVEGNEQVGSNDRIMMYPHTGSDKIEQLEVWNMNGSYTFIKTKPTKDAKEEAICLKGHTELPLNANLTSLFLTTAGYSLTTLKIDSSDVAKYGLAEYGLADEKRVDADGNEYDYSPAWFKMTDDGGKTYKVFVGNKTPMGDGYYVRYADRDAVYIIASTGFDALYDIKDRIKSTVFADVESFCVPQLTAPMTMQSYFNVEGFTYWNQKTAFDDPFSTRPLILFSYIDVDDRMMTEYQYIPYFSIPDLEIDDGNGGKILLDPLVDDPNEYAIDTMLQNLYMVSTRDTGVKVVSIDITEDELKKYGVYDPAYRMMFTYAGAEHEICVSEKTKDDTYYMLSAIYDIIIEVDASYFRFFEWNDARWMAQDIIRFNIAFTKTLELKTKDLSFSFVCDNSKSEMKDTINSNNIEIFLEEESKLVNTKQFRNFFNVLTYTRFEGEAGLSDEDVAKLIADENNLMLTLRYTTNGRDNEYKFYRYSERRAYVTLNGFGGLYVLSSQVEKIISDVQKILTGETINPEQKYD